MNFLALLLILKIGLSLALLVRPFMMAPTKALNNVMSLYGDNPLIYRLYSIAILSLCVAYGFGLYEALAGRMPWNVIAFGIVSNAGAALALTALNSHPKLRPFEATFATIAAALVLCALAPNYALMSI